jgi:hypothetical protein
MSKYENTCAECGQDDLDSLDLDWPQPRAHVKMGKTKTVITITGIGDLNKSMPEFKDKVILACSILAYGSDLELRDTSHGIPVEFEPERGQHQ